MPKPYPKEFRDDVVAVARKGQAPLKQIAKDFRDLRVVSAWLDEAGRHRGRSPSRPELKKRTRLLEQENEVLRRAAAYLGEELRSGVSPQPDARVTGSGAHQS